MKHTKEEILNALMVIKETCDEYEECEMCPFGSENDESCNLKFYVPSVWDMCPLDWRGWR